MSRRDLFCSAGSGTEKNQMFGRSDVEIKATAVGTRPLGNKRSISRSSWIELARVRVRIIVLPDSVEWRGAEVFDVFVSRMVLLSAEHLSLGFVLKFVILQLLLS